MELCASLGIVIGWNGFNGEIISYLQFIAILHHLARTIYVGTTLAGDESCLITCQQLDGILVEVVKVLMSHQEIVGLGHGGIVNCLVAQLRHGINLNLFAVILNADASMYQGMELRGLAAFRLEYVHLVGVCCDRHSCFFPRNNATFEVHTLITDVSQFICCIG